MLTHRHRRTFVALALLVSLTASVPSAHASGEIVAPTGLRTVLAYAGCALSVFTGTAWIPAVRAVFSCGSLFMAQTE